MKKRLMFSALLVVVAGFAQSVTTPPGKFIPSAEWKKMLDGEPTGAVGGQAARLLLPETFVIRRRVPGPNNASVHAKDVDGSDVTEVYYILEGTGEFVTGGSYDPKNRTQGIKGGEKHAYKPGDVLIIPPGVVHWFSRIDGHVTYVQAQIPGNAMAEKARKAPGKP